MDLSICLFISKYQLVDALCGDVVNRERITLPLHNLRCYPYHDHSLINTGEGKTSLWSFTHVQITGYKTNLFLFVFIVEKGRKQDFNFHICYH